MQKFFGFFLAHGLQFGRQAVNFRRQLRDRRRLKDQPEREFHLEDIARAHDELGAEQRVAAHGEKIIFHIYFLQSEQRRENGCESFSVSVRGAVNVRSRKVLAPSGAGKLVRSTFPLAVNGRLSKRIKDKGIM